MRHKQEKNVGLLRQTKLQKNITMSYTNVNRARCKLSHTQCRWSWWSFYSCRSGQCVPCGAGWRYSTYSCYCMCWGRRLKQTATLSFLLIRVKTAIYLLQLLANLFFFWRIKKYKITNLKLAQYVIPFCWCVVTYMLQINYILWVFLV